MLPVYFLAFAGLALLWVLFAFWQSVRAALSQERGADHIATTDDRAALIAEKNALLRSIKDLEFERGVGKISDEDFEKLDAKYRGRAKEILAKLDDDLGEFRDCAAELIAARLETVVDIAADSAPEVAAKDVTSRLACAKCETKNDADAAFCKKCGASLRTEEAT